MNYYCVLNVEVCFVLTGKWQIWL